MSAAQAMTARDRAIAEQLEASDPAVSAFVDASAGSGKTKLLTDRMLRLMLAGTEPGRMECLTFTKAAAAEMALRLQHRLGEWVTIGDAGLDRHLSALRVQPGAAVRARARALFALVLDQPGGMRIGTIHAFCQSLLRRFPLEAQLSPHFELVEEAEAEAGMRAAREAVLEHADPADVATVAGLVRAEEFGPLMRDLQSARGRLRPLLGLPGPALAARVRAAAGAAGSDGEALQAGITWDSGPIEAALRVMAAKDTDAVRRRAGCLLAWLGMDAARRAADWGAWCAEFFTKDGKPRALGQFPNKGVAAAHPEIRPLLEAEQERIGAVEALRRAVRCAEATAALLRLAAPALAGYEAGKQRAGLLDYADLIERAGRLLVDPGAAWILFKLDGGIDHLLLDEVQDTAPEQWAVAHRLTEEFFAGLGAREDRAGPEAPPRTFFAVGDPKQSIYSFQGADPAEFIRSRGLVAARVAGAEREWRDVTLDVSFRSTAPVLALVDAVFADEVAGQGVVKPGAGLLHLADRAGQAGRVELWPLAPVPAKDADGPAWELPARNLGLRTAPQLLAEAVAGSIAAELAGGRRLESQGRPARAGDYLVLVRSRGRFAAALVRALKAKGVPVAGLDRLVLTEQIAVQDVLAVLDAVLLPQDCLAVANVLTSPLGGLTDDSLMALALGRPGRLWDALRERADERADWAAAHGFLRALAERADFCTPHALLAEALGRMGGRARLLARLGAEAAEPIDELLNAALAYGRQHAPSLQGFVHWLRRSGAEVKREAGGSGGAVRVMTVHGAKGLQAPVVVLPDTTGLPPAKERLAWAGDVPLWVPRKELSCPASEMAKAEAARLRQEEYNRLLYVALTRAEDRLVVCGWAPRSAKADAPPVAPDESWYSAVARGIGRLGPVAEPFDRFGTAQEALVLRTAQEAEPRHAAAAMAVAAARLPAWAGRPGAWRAAAPPAEPPLPRPLAPSRPGGLEHGPVPAAASPLGRTAGPAYARGLAAHALLQHLPDLADGERAAAAASFLGRSAVPEGERERLGREVLAVLAHPALSALFGPGSRAEQPLTGLVGGTVVSGVVDRMVVLPEAVLVADFKTGRAAPERVEDTPVRFLRQLAAYRAVLRAAFPGRAVRCALVWTEDAAVVVLPDALLDGHGPG